MLPKVVVMGAAGRMGRMLLEVAGQSGEVEIAGALERAGSEAIGTRIGGVAVTDDPIAAIAGAQIVLDFTTPAATVATAELTAQARCVHVVGTTGLTEADHAALDRAGRHAVIVQAGNMSLGVNLLTVLTRRVARALGPDWDIEVVEAHHGRKVDAPSGTALMLGEAAAAGRDVVLADVADRGRDGITGARLPGNIGFAAIRGGDIVGEHDVIFAGQGERIVLRHMATDRRIFARGALKAGLWGLKQEPGRYDMLSVLGLTEDS